ncbi:MAG: RNA pyrophosphohydrolase [Alphaproteobacteria bacterium]|nr:RNA pyrophosphohydrolase [Alphaproteobacteria bacterium]
MTGNYRKNVGIVVFNQNKKVLMCARADSDDFNWQFPQGGIDKNEKIIDAAKRELKEETGITSVELVAKMPKSLRYDFPDYVLAKFKNNKFVGQDQYWVLFYFNGDDSEINFNTNPKEVEFKAYEWVDISEAPKRIVEFKKAVYSKVVNAFKPYIRAKKGKYWQLSAEMIKHHIMQRIRINVREGDRGGR